MVRLWLHESERTYSDRLVSTNDINVFKAMLFENVKKNFPKYNFSKYYSN